MAKQQVDENQIRGSGSVGFVYDNASTVITIKANLSATAAPTVSNDSSQGYAKGSIWMDTTNSIIYQAISVGVGAASWSQLTNGAGVTAPTGTANSTTVWRGDNTWATGVTGGWSASTLTLSAYMDLNAVASSTPAYTSSYFLNSSVGPVLNAAVGLYTTLSEGNGVVATFGYGRGSIGGSYWGIGTYGGTASGNASLGGIYWKGVNLVYNVTSAQAHEYRINDVVQASLGLGGFTSLATTGTVTAANIAILGISTGLQLNVPTGSSLIQSINGVAQSTLNATSLTLAGLITLPAASPTIDTTKNQIYGSTGGIGVSVPTGTGVYSQVNGVTLFVAGVANSGVGAYSWGIGAYGLNAASYPSYPGIYSSAGSDMVFNVLATFNYKFNQGNAASSSITPYGFSGPGFYSTGTIYSTTGTNLSIICDAANTWSYNVPTSGSHLFKINAVVQATLNATGLTLAAALSVTGKIGNTVAANPVQFAIPTPVVVATVTATAIPGLSTTFRGCIEVQGSDGSYGRFQLPQGSTTSTLVYGSATVSGGVPASTKWGIDYSAGWRFNNQTAGAITFTLIEVLTGIA